MVVAAALAVAGAVVAAGCGEDARDEGPFAYDRSVPLDARDGGVVHEAAGLVVRDVSFVTPAGRVEGLLVAPKGARGLPAAVYVHGAGGDRTSMLAAASSLAARRAVALTLTQPSTAATATGSDARERLRIYRDVTVADVLAVRRAIDFLETRPEVDPARIGYLGWSAGARTGALLSGVDERLRGLVLLSGGSATVRAYVDAASDELRGEVERVLTEIDPLHWVARAEPDRLLLQNGEQDEVVPREALDALADAAPEGTDVRWYPAGHALDADAYTEHLDWLAERLGIEGPPVVGTANAP